MQTSYIDFDDVTGNDRPMLAVIIPTLNAEAALARCLPDLVAETIIVSDGLSEDDTLSVAIKSRAILAIGTVGRGSQLARGAKLACLREANWLLFLHSDTQLPKDWRASVSRHIETYPETVGYFRYAVQEKGVMPRLQAFLVALRCWAWKMPYGDQGLLISREAYNAVGGYADMPLFEDVDMMNRLKSKLGRSRIKPLAGKIYTDVSAYQSEGWWKRGARNFKLYRAFQNGTDVDVLKMEYYND